MTVAELMNKSDHDLFSKLCAQTHALNHLLNRASLRTRGHSYQLPEYSTDLYKKSFLIRCLSLSSEIVFGFAALYYTSFWHCFLCLLFDVRLSQLINITCIHTYTYYQRMYRLCAKVVFFVKAKHAGTVLYDSRSQLFARHDEPSTVVNNSTANTSYN